MITRIAALEFMQQIVGSYKSSDGATQLTLTRCGYGQAVEFRSNNVVKISAVVGAAGTTVELFAQIGLPNVVHLLGDLQSKDVILFKAKELPVSLLLARDGETLSLTTSLHDRINLHHVLQRA